MKRVRRLNEDLTSGMGFVGGFALSEYRSEMTASFVLFVVELG